MARILVIDDDPQIVQVLKIRLKFAGHEVLTAADGIVGLRLALESKPDLVVMDIWMPAGGGFSVAYRLREQAPELPFIFLTASKKEGLREMAASLGAAGFLEKPYEKENLLAAVDKALKAKPASPVSHPNNPDQSALARAVGVRPSRGAATPAGRGVSESAAALGKPETTVREAARTPTQSPSVVAPANCSTPKPPARITGKNKILIVEDDRKIALALAVRLRTAGQDVLLAYDAVTGLDSAIKNRPDLVLLDIGLPAGSGLVVAERIQNLVSRYTPVIFLTASRQPGLRQQALALGAVGFLEKPYNADELLAAIQKALQAPDSPSGAQP